MPLCFMAEENRGPRTEVPRCGVAGGVDRWVGTGLWAGRQTGRGSVRHVGPERRGAWQDGVGRQGPLVDLGI